MSKTIRYQFSERAGTNYGERRGGRAIVKEESRIARRDNDIESVKEGVEEYENPSE